MADDAQPTDRGPRLAAAALILSGAAVAVALGVYAREHEPAGRPIETFGFSGMLQMKAWLTTAALALVVVQLLTALAMWGRLGGGAARRTPTRIAVLHRWSGAVAFIVLLPVVFHCVWALGFATSSARVFAHCVLGCAFYGAYAAKMLALRLPGLPGWTLPLLGGTVFTAAVVLWLSAALWFFTRSGVPLT